jgi:hypothetical protein
MREYEVSIYETVIHTAVVEAANEEEAYSKAYEIIANGPDDGYDTEAEGFTGAYVIEDLGPA